MFNGLLLSAVLVCAVGFTGEPPAQGHGIIPHDFCEMLEEEGPCAFGPSDADILVAACPMMAREIFKKLRNCQH